MRALLLSAALHVAVLVLAPTGEPLRRAASPELAPLPVTLLEFSPEDPDLEPMLASPKSSAPTASSRPVEPRPKPRTPIARSTTPAQTPADSPPEFEAERTPSLPSAHAEPVPAPVPTVAVPPSPRGLSEGELRAYARSVRSELIHHRRYPPAALRLGLEGVVKLRLAIDRGGVLVGDPRVLESSGHAVLDEEALRVVEAAAPFRSLPANSDKDELVFVIPIEFHLAAQAGPP